MSDSRNLNARLAAGPRFLILGQGCALGGKPVEESVAAAASPTSIEQLPEDLVRIDTAVADFPWNGVLTSDTRPGVAEAFKSSWRRVIPTGSAELGRNPRNATELHVRYLFGGSGLPPEERPPGDVVSLARREQEAREMLDALVSRLVTPRGVIVIDEWSTQDWLTTKDVFGLATRLQPGQVHLFSATDEMVADPLLAAGVQHGGLVLHPEPLAELVAELVDRGLVSAGAEAPGRVASRLLPWGDAFLEIPTDVWNGIIGVARPVDVELLEPYPRSSSATDYQRFRGLLGASEGAPPWKAIASGFKLIRDYEHTLSEVVGRAIGAGEDAGPIILQGQTATGKSLALCALAQHIAREGSAAVLHLSRRAERPSWGDVETFSNWVDAHTGLKTVLIWDGMVAPDDYFELQRQMRARGQRVIVVGSTYLSETRTSAHFVTAPIQLSASEATRTAAWFTSHGVEVPFPRMGDDVSFLALLYRTLPAMEPPLRRGLARELRSAEGTIERLARTPARRDDNEAERLTAVAEALQEAGVVVGELAPADHSTAELADLSVEQRSVTEQLSAILLTAGRRGLTVPLEITMRIVGRDGAQVIVDFMRKFDIFRWTEDDRGEQFLGVRTRLEAELLAREDLRPSSEADVICSLIRSLKPTLDWSGGGEVQFLVDLMEQVGPQSVRPSGLSDWYVDFADALQDLRLERGYMNHRLALIEANLVREYVKGAQTSREMSAPDRLAQLAGVEELVLDALSYGDVYGQPRLNLLVELAAARGAQVVELEKSKALSRPEAARVSALMEQVVDAALDARRINPESMHPVDVISWATAAAIGTGALSEDVSLRLLADARASLDSLDPAGLSPRQRAMFDRDQVRMAVLMKDANKETEHLVALMNNGDPAAYYLLARLALESPEPDAKNVALKVLLSAPAEVRSDWKCARLLLDLFWETKSGHRLLKGEREALAFSSADWSECLDLADSLLDADGFDHHRVAFVRGLAHFHLGSLRAARDDFHSIERSELFIRSRVVSAYLASDPSGERRRYTGQVQYASQDGRRGHVWVNQLQDNVDFIPLQFHPTRFRTKGEALPEFHIAFNYRGFLADPIRYSDKAR